MTANLDQLLSLLNGFKWIPYSFSFYVEPKPGLDALIRATMSVGPGIGLVLDFTRARGWYVYSLNSNGMRKIAELPREPTSAVVLAIWRRRLQLESGIDRLYNIYGVLNGWISQAGDPVLEEEIDNIDTFLQMVGVKGGLKALRSYIGETLTSIDDRIVL